MSVELERVGWEDGTQITPARVNVGGVTYDVTDATYSGETPLSAQNLKKMETNTQKALNDLNQEEYTEDDGKGYSATYINGVSIVETGSNSNGNWIKFGDGTMIVTQFYHTTIQTNQWSAWGSCYAADLAVPPNYPQTFIDYPCVTKSISNVGNNAWSYWLGADGVTRSGQMGVVRPTAAGAATQFTVNVIAIGKWK